MEFGRVPEPQLNVVDFSLPPEPAFNKMVLTGQRVQEPLVYIGCPKWGVKEWVGKIFPKGTKDDKFLENYVQHFNSIELNATHYKVYGPDMIARWAAKAGQRPFKFCPKVPQLISHQSNFINVDAVATSFLEGVLAFGDHLGPIFLQVSESFSPLRKQHLFNHLRSLPTNLQFFLEVRHPDWFAIPAVRQELFETLHRLGWGAVITDTAGRGDCAHMHLPVKKAFVRFVSNSLHATDYTRIDSWVERIAYWINQGLEELYFFLHMHDEIYSPELAVYLADKLNAACSLQLQKPQFIQPGKVAAGTQISFFD